MKKIIFVLLFILLPLNFSGGGEEVYDFVIMIKVKNKTIKEAAEIDNEFRKISKEYGFEQMLIPSREYEKTQKLVPLNKILKK